MKNAGEMPAFFLLGVDIFSMFAPFVNPDEYDRVGTGAHPTTPLS